MFSTSSDRSLAGPLPTLEENRTVNYFFAKMKVVYGQKFYQAMPSDADQDAQKQFYCSLIGCLGVKTIDSGFAQIALLRTQGRHVWLDIAEILPYFVHSLKSEADLLHAYNEYSFGGQEVKQEQLINGRLVNTGVGRIWTSGALSETARRLGPCSHLPGNEKAKQEQFNRMYQIVLQEEQNGAEFLVPIGISKQDTPADKQVRLEKSRKSSAYEKFKKSTYGSIKA